MLFLLPEIPYFSTLLSELRCGKFEFINLSDEDRNIAEEIIKANDFSDEVMEGIKQEDILELLKYYQIKR